MEESARRLGPHAARVLAVGRDLLLSWPPLTSAWHASRVRPQHESSCTP
jgi:hypothetical protein